MTETEAQIATAESYEQMQIRARTVAVSLNTAAQQRLVWFVAIAGWVLFNGKQYWELFAGTDLSPAVIFWLSFPWACVAVAAVITHIMFEQLELADIRYHTAVLTSIRMYCIDLQTGKKPPCQFEDILYDKVDTLAEFKKVEEIKLRKVTFAERLTQILLIIGFISTVFGPWLLHFYIITKN